MSKASEIQDLMFNVGKILARWLDEHLAEVTVSYWDDLVVPKLSYQQRTMVEANRLTSLDSLDFASLLRVFDKNWHELDFNRSSVIWACVQRCGWKRGNRLKTILSANI